ncbi:MAG: carboxymuconolactone decarboxylase family protein [Phycisphaerae bacterium]
MPSDINTFFTEWKTGTERMKQQAPDIAKGYGSFYHTLMKEGALASREKELIALAIALTSQCTQCLYWHLRKALSVGATREQILEAAGVAVIMQGGPAFTRVPDVIKALEDLEDVEGVGQV